MQLLVILLAYIFICQRMENRDWMYTGHASMTPEWMTKTNAFLEHSFGEAARGSSRMPCPCSKCDNRVRKNRKNVGEGLCKYGFTPNYTCWIHHGEADRIREEVVRHASRLLMEMPG